MLAIASAKRNARTMKNASCERPPAGKMIRSVCAYLMMSSFDASEWLPVRSGVTRGPSETKYRWWASKRGVTQKQEAQAAGLMLRAQQGEEEAYAELLVLLTAATRSYVRSRVGPLVPWIDDAVQETLVAVHHARHTFDGHRPFAPWFYAIARNRFVDVLPREQRVRQHEISGAVWPELASATDDGTARVDMDAVQQALASLPSRQREV